ncbi:homogentisate 1,2-dioxygenase [Paucibacter sp. R3-3]|uniref:Homogentisate 1,2-dioxygenase n=1 Tax=Roseateles agri TaxID=3098619 RepID=A0ABU5DBY8_9BURK|nr:homogentisate 1,2-dioxygenase [Paucibacter sp. R3-3]MDY0743788.1 homogentisate 1,2-dioxygenase [Paucibacter sp. R3-3]
MSPLQYQSGFGNEHASEAHPGALPVGRNSPQKVALGLYAELLSGTAFTAPRAENLRTWMYRRRPSVVVGGYRPLEHRFLKSGAAEGQSVPPDPLRWAPTAIPDASTEPLDFVDGLRTFAVNGDPDAQVGIAVHLYLANRSMGRRAFVDADGELLIVPQQGALRVTTELGLLDVKPGEIALIPRGLVFKIDVDGPARGYVCENHGAAFRLPELGPIGSNGLANPRDFLAPVAAYEAEEGAYEIVKKFGGRLWTAEQAHTPFNVVAWHGNLSPYKYDTAHFMTIGSISFDHPDPSIFTVLTSPSDTEGWANADFVIFPPRWLVAEDTFRPPWYHRNVMSEFMGLVTGQYDAKPEGFKPGGASLHNAMVPHGPDTEAFDKASNAPLVPHKLDNTLAFMFETRWRLRPTEFALTGGALEATYANCWANLADNFKN